MTERSLYREILDRIVLWRMEALNGYDELQEPWFDPETDMLDRDRLPGHMLGQYDQVFQNAIPLADSISGLIHRKLT